MWVGLLETLSKNHILIKLLLLHNILIFLCIIYSSKFLARYMIESMLLRLHIYDMDGGVLTTIQVLLLLEHPHEHLLLLLMRKELLVGVNLL